MSFRILHLVVYIYFLNAFFLHAVDLRDLTSWAGAECSEEQLCSLRSSIAQETLFDIQTDLRDRNFGMSLPGINPLQRECLEDIHTLYSGTSKGERVPVIDIGAGTGMMTWKMIVAGGFVTAAELNIAPARLIKENVLQNAKAFMTDAEKKHLPARLAIKDFLEISDEIHTGLYDIAWAGQNIHFFKPDQIPAYLEKIYRILKPGGRAYLTSVTPTKTDGDILKTYFEARKQKRAFPGYMVRNQIQLINMLERFPDGKIRSVVKDVNVMWIPPSSNLHHGQVLRVFLNENAFSEELIQYMENLTTHHREYRLRSHVLNLFDDEVFYRIFTIAGFDIEKIYYFSLKDNKKIIDACEFTDDMRNEKYWAIAIKVIKPFAKKSLAQESKYLRCTLL